MLGISHLTLRRKFRAELDVGHIEAGAKVAATLFAMATDPKHPRAAICAMFYLKCRAGWKEEGNKPPPGKEEVRENAAELAQAVRDQLAKLDAGTEQTSDAAPAAE